MAKKKKKAEVKKGSWPGRFFHVVTSTPVWQLILLVVIVGLLWWQWPNIETVLSAIWGALGWGLLFIAAAIIVLIVQIKRHKLSSFLFQWHRWLGGVAFVFAIWGILGFTRQGGAFGRWLIAFSQPDFVGVLCILGWLVLGIILVAPTASWRGLVRFFSWLGAQISRRPTPRRPVSREVRTDSRRVVAPPAVKPSLPPEMEKDIMPPEGEGAEPAITSAKTELRQVAQDVWKKYGQSAELVTIDGWKLPPLDILDVTPEVTFSEADNLQRARLIEEALASYGVEGKVVQINAGPTVTQFGVEPGWDRKYREVKEKDKDGHIQVSTREVSKTRVKVERITSLANDMALALAAPSIRIEAPVPGKSIVGIEVPNTTSDMVSLRGVIETSVFQKQVSRSRMAIALGKGAGGEAVAADLTKMPHLLIAGATGSGKTVCLNAIISCLLMHNTPHDVRFIMVDPKRVELTQYNSIPHLATPVIVDTTRALNSLRWLNQEMDGRYQKMAAAGARHIEGYNKIRKGAEKLPYLVLVIDELADLMMSGSDEVETILCRLAQLARATGIHLVVATQRPSVDVVTGLIKANFPTRISFAVTSQVDSRTILDGAGAEKLLGRGDMLYMPTEAAKPKRLQGCFLSDAEMERLVYFWGSQKPEEPDKMRMETLVATAPTGTIGGYPRDPLLEQARELARNYDNVSTSFLQRKLHIGYPRAARLFDQLTEVMAGEKEVPDDAGEGEPKDDLRL
jgi:S-DNA-T family DNA segregation ATPase FtsK/SpoIIIE